MRVDEPWGRVPIQLLCIMETTLAISAASMAVLKPLLAQLGCIGDTPVISRASNANQHEPGQGNNINGKRTAPSAFARSTSLGPNIGLTTLISSVAGATGYDGADMHIEGDDAHTTRAHGRPADIELGKLDESIYDEACGQDSCSFEFDKIPKNE